MISCPKKTNFS